MKGWQLNGCQFYWGKVRHTSAARILCKIAQNTRQYGMPVNTALCVIKTMDDRAFTTLIEYLSKVPAITGEIGKGTDADGRWWVKFTIDINHEYSWHTVQEMGHVLNYLSIDERLPTSFHPVSPPPYMNGGPDEYLSWVIECMDPEFKPGTCAKWLEGRLPRPVEDLSQWKNE